ncbi:MAG: MFS transporter [Acidobacteria bacterium]|nr:MFS transporter [Acidobacteriota bacterium]MCA1652013.1 MFS transporter [Acidobacteriota bacterium]
MTNSAHAPQLRLTPTEWLICIIAAIGFAFDTYELLMLPLIVGPALGELVNARLGTPEYAQWVGRLFFVPAVFGGIFGLLGGYLTDRFGRRSVLTWSILLYAFSALAAGFATNIYWLLFFRCTTFVGVCVEFVAATAWLAELFSEPKRRERVLGYTQAFGSVGGILVTAAYYLCVTYGERFPAIAGGHAAWRYTLISGIIPAIPLIIIRPFLPESPIWREKKKAGTLKRPSVAELFAPRFRKTTIVTTIMFACSYGAAFGAIQHMPRIVPGLEDVRTLAPAARQQAVSAVQSFQEFGGLLGRMLLAFLAVRILARRPLLWVFQVPGLFVVPLVFFLAADSSLEWAKWGIFFAGLFTVAQFSFWGNYLPRVYPTYLRGTGESFAANVGGRMIGTFAAYVTPTMAASMPGGSPTRQLAYAAAAVALVVYVVGFLTSFKLPEPKEQELPE